MEPTLAPLAHDEPALPTEPAAAEAEVLRVMELHVTSPSGAPLSLLVPWDRTPRDLAHALVAGTDLEMPDRTVRAFSQAADDLLDVPLRRALRHDGNPGGATTVILQVEGALSTFEGVLTTAGVSEPRAHEAYPHPLDAATEARLAPYLAGEQADWFCDGQSGLPCCATTRAAPSEQSWVYL